MQKQIWYGVKDNNVLHANNQQALTSAGVSNPQSFTVNGEVTGLDFIGTTEQQATGASSQQSAS
jgi:hypothetical protein